MIATIMRAAALSAVLLSGPVLAQGAGETWTKYRDANYGFSADLPSGFEPLSGADTAGVTLVETGGSGQISLYGGPADGMTIEDFAARLSAGEQVRTVTYKADSRSWFVLSGYYDQNEAGQEPLIFYTKVLFSADRSSFSAFEISYPQDEKARFDPIVDHIENSFTRPRR